MKDMMEITPEEIIVIFKFVSKFGGISAEAANKLSRKNYVFLLRTLKELMTEQYEIYASDRTDEEVMKEHEKRSGASAKQIIEILKQEKRQSEEN